MPCDGPQMRVTLPGTPAMIPTECTFHKTGPLTEGRPGRCSSLFHPKSFSKQPGQDCVPVQGPLVSLGRLWGPSWDIGENRLLGFFVPGECTGHGFVCFLSTPSFTVKGVLKTQLGPILLGFACHSQTSPASLQELMRSAIKRRHL